MMSIYHLGYTIYTIIVDIPPLMGKTYYSNGYIMGINGYYGL